MAHACNEFASKISGIHISPIFDNYNLDFAVEALHGSTFVVAILSVIQLSTPQPSLFDEGLRLTPEVNDMLEELKAIVSQLRAKRRGYSRSYRIKGVLVAGRRLKLRDNEKTTLKSLNDSHEGVTILSYDWFIDAASRYFNPLQMSRYMGSRHAINTSLDSLV